MLCASVLPPPSLANAPRNECGDLMQRIARKERVCKLATIFGLIPHLGNNTRLCQKTVRRPWKAIAELAKTYLLTKPSAHVTILAHRGRPYVSWRRHQCAGLRRHVMPEDLSREGSDPRDPPRGELPATGTRDNGYAAFANSLGTSRSRFISLIILRVRWLLCRRKRLELLGKSS